MTPKGSQHPRHRSKTVQRRQRLAPLRGAYATKPLAGGVAWDPRPTLDHRLIAGKPPACLSSSPAPM